MALPPPPTPRASARFFLVPGAGKKDTRRALGATHQVDAGGHDVRRLAAARQVLGQRHLVEVEGRVQAMLVQLKLVAQDADVLLGYETQTHWRLN